jgi:hypothetical protein
LAGFAVWTTFQVRAVLAARDWLVNRRLVYGAAVFVVVETVSVTPRLSRRMNLLFTERHAHFTY